MQTPDDLRLHAARFEKDAEILNREALSWHRTWALSLGVANGAGCLALGSALVNSKLDLWLIALPSLWAFAVGLLISGVLPYAYYRANQGQQRAFELLKTATERALLGQPKDDLLPDITTAGLAYAWWSRASSLLSVASAFAFSLGLLWPLLKWTLRF